MKQLLNWFGVLSVVVALAVIAMPHVEAQRGSGIVKQQTIDNDEEALTITNLSDIPTFGISVVNNGTYQLDFEGSVNGGTVWVGHFCTVNDDSGDTASTTTAEGTWFCTNPGLTNFRVRAEAYTNGAPVVTVTRGYAKGGGLGNSGGGGLTIDPAIDDGAILVNNAGTIDGWAGNSCSAGMFILSMDQFGAATCGTPGDLGSNPMINYVSDYYYMLGGAGVNIATTTANNAADRNELIPFRPTTTVTFEELGTTTGTGGAQNVKMLVYDSDATGGFPGTLLYSSEALSTASGNTYIFDNTGLPTFTGGHLYWVGLVASGTVQMRMHAVTDLQHLVGLGQTSTNSSPASVIRQVSAGSYTTPLNPFGYNVSQLLFGAHGPLVVAKAP